jgi:hypothetical protein
VQYPFKFIGICFSKEAFLSFGFGVNLCVRAGTPLPLLSAFRVHPNMAGESKIRADQPNCKGSNLGASRSGEPSLRAKGGATGAGIGVVGSAKSLILL